MSVISTLKWYDVLREIISDATVRDNIARAVGVHPMTLVHLEYWRDATAPALRRAVAQGRTRR